MGGKIYHRPRLNASLESMPFPNTLFCLIVYDRLNNLARWMNAWKYCKKENTKLVVIRNKSKHELTTQSNFLDCFKKHGSPDYYFVRSNVGMDIGAFQDLCKQRYSIDFDWEYVMWCVDDSIPLSRYFLEPFLTQVEDPKVGVCGSEITDRYAPTHLRTNAFCMSRELAFSLKWIKPKIVTKQDCYMFEHLGGRLTLRNQVLGKGLKVVQATGSFSYPIWDVNDRGSIRGYPDRWNEHFNEFPDSRQFGKIATK